jgi:hypothetical protein
MNIIRYAIHRKGTVMYHSETSPSGLTNSINDVLFFKSQDEVYNHFNNVAHLSDEYDEVCLVQIKFSKYFELIK